MKTWFALVINLLIAVLFITGVARADETAKTKARQHFKQGVEQFDQRRFGDALTEFEQSYTLFPVYSTLYNVGQVHVALGHPVQAIDAYEKYLVQGGASVPADQRARVESELKTQRERVGDIKLDVTPEGAEVRVDGESVGQAPLKNAIKVAAGHHRVEAMLDGYRTERSEVDVSGQGHIEMMFKLQPLPQMAATVPAATRPTTSSTIVNIAPAPASSLPASAAQNARNDSALSHREQYSESSSAGTVQRVFGYVIAGAGLIGTGIGVAFAVDGQSKHDDALEQYAQDQKAQAQQTESDSSKEKTKGYIVIGAGGAAMLTGAILLISAPSGHSGIAGMNLLPWVGTSVAGGSVGGTW